jgi:hypothetical protein
LTGWAEVKYVPQKRDNSFPSRPPLRVAEHAVRQEFMATWNTWGEQESYCWAVICKNNKFHRQENLFSGHKIPLGETDAFTPPPVIDFRLTVRCDECGEEYAYDPAELVRFQTNFPPDFKPHPLFTSR